MGSSADMRTALLDMDLPMLRRIWAHVSPHLPQPRTDAETEIVAHRARTESRAMPMRARAYSHRWLEDRGYPSGLPDELRPKAERLYPKVVAAVGISVNARGLMAPIVPHIRVAMEHAVEECFADGHRETEIVRPRMMAAKAKTVRQLLGINGAS